mmetsp:Transcript_1707/g.3984  ORF Transcript_1707/g.3984 Transcript_1707/m.3984 type:complete len:215 (+) Transcript_1707:190-834(+)
MARFEISSLLDVSPQKNLVADGFLSVLPERPPCDYLAFVFGAREGSLFQSNDVFSFHLFQEFFVGLVLGADFLPRRCFLYCVVVLSLSPLHSPTAVGCSATAGEIVPLFGIEMIVITQKLSRLDVPNAVNPVADPSLDVDAHHLAVGRTRVVDEAALVCKNPGIDVIASRQGHDVKVGIVWVLLAPKLEAVFFFFLVDDLPHVFLDKLVLGNVL